MAPSLESEAESTLLSLLETSTSPSTSVYSSYSDFLLPFSELNSKSGSNSKVIRPLVKKFLSFLNRAIAILPRRLSDPSKLRSQPDSNFVHELFRTYDLCLDCLESVSSQLSGKPYDVYFQRLKFFYCLETWGLFLEAEKAGFRTLEKIRATYHGEWGKLLPVVTETVEADMAKLVVKMVIGVVKCVVLRRSDDSKSYVSVMTLVKESQPWLRLLDSVVYETIHQCLVTYLGKCTVIAIEMAIFQPPLVREITLTALNEYSKASSKYQIYKFARRLCSSLFLDLDSKHIAIETILKCILNFLAVKPKIDINYWESEFMDTVSYCSYKCLNAKESLRYAVARILEDLAENFLSERDSPSGSILKLYSCALSFNDRLLFKICHSSSCNDIQDIHISAVFLDNLDHLCKLSSLLNSVRPYIIFHHMDKHRSTVNGFKNPNPVSYAQENNYLQLYVNVLKFICKPLSVLVNSRVKDMIFECNDESLNNALCNIHDVCNELCLVYFSFKRSAVQLVGDDDNDISSQIIVNAALSSFILSIRTESELQKSISLIENIVTCDWIQIQRQSCIFDFLCNVGIFMYQTDRADKASKTLESCCKLMWTSLLALCQRCASHSKDSIVEISENDILDSFNEASKKSAVAYEILWHCSKVKMKENILQNIETWSIAENFVSCLPGPGLLVRQWTKVMYGSSKSMGKNHGETLFSLLSLSTKISKKALRKILEQELSIYEEMETTRPEYFQIMQLKVLDAFLDHIYVNPDNYSQRTDILIRKAWASRNTADGSTCINLLSDAILLMDNEMYRRESSCRHNLVVAYCLRSLTRQEFEACSKEILDDVERALKGCLIVQDGNCECDGKCLLSNRGMCVLYNIVDLLALKGNMELHNDLLKLMFTIFKQKNVPLEKCISMFWETRRLSHSLCVSPIDNMFLMSLSDVYGKSCASFDLWLSCLNDSGIGFRQNFSCPMDNLHYVDPIIISVEDIKELATSQISCGSSNGSSQFLAAYLYYDLSERLIASGQLLQAFLYAKEAHQLRTKLFIENFVYKVESETSKGSDSSDHHQDRHRLCHLELRRSVARNFWCSNIFPLEDEVFYTSPWKVLQCYLESILQIGIIHEMLGNGIEAEKLLLWGKDISCSEDLPFLMSSFSSALGTLYIKKNCWELAEKELHKAQILIQNCDSLSCSSCKLKMEVTIEHQIGNCYLSRTDVDKISVKMEEICRFETLHRLSLERIKTSFRKNSVICPGSEMHCAHMLIRSSTETSDWDSLKGDSKVKIDHVNRRKSKNVSTSTISEPLRVQNNIQSRMTRSRCRLQKQDLNQDTYHASTNRDVVDVPGHSETSGKFPCNDNTFRCLFCYGKGIQESCHITSFIYLKWEIVYRRLSMRLLSSIGKCMEFRNQIHEAHEIIFQRISFLSNQDPFSRTPFPLAFFLTLACNELPWDVFAIDRMELVYDISWVVLKFRTIKYPGNPCCSVSGVQLQSLVSCLMVTFVLCHQIPVLLQKISKLLSVIFILSSACYLQRLQSYSKVLSDSHWASFFHQVSVGTNFSFQYLFDANSSNKEQLLGDKCFGDEGYKESFNLGRIAPEFSNRLEYFVKDFFSSLPRTTIICISVFGGYYQEFLHSLLEVPSKVHSWILLSRLDPMYEPVVLLLPIDSMTTEDFVPAPDDDVEMFDLAETSENVRKQWRCPWDFTVVDEVASPFRFILEQNYFFSSKTPSDDTQESRKKWWMQRKDLDFKLSNFMRKLEESWFGPWKHVLQVDQYDSLNIDSVLKGLVRNLKSKCKIDIGGGLLKILFSVAQNTSDLEACLFRALSMRNGCVLGKPGYFNKDINTCEELDTMTCKLIELLNLSAAELKDEESAGVAPLILVPDFDVQMLPWESLPILRQREVYRMPSVASVCLALCRVYHEQQEAPTSSTYPLIDPLDAFYLLNPSGDLNSTQLEFENLFEQQNLKGKAGIAPSSEELALALKTHDFFIYLGHGSGDEYIPCHEIRRLERCAGSLLLGCSSGSLSLQGPYVPYGAPLAYLLAGAPVIIANLWEVTDGDIDRFGKAMLDALVTERLKFPRCIQCDLLTEDFESMEIKNDKPTTTMKGSKRAPSEPHRFCTHRRAIAAFMCQAREACRLPYLTGAAPVCYGIPTGIRRKSM